MALFDCGVDAKLRGCDLVKLRVSDVVSGGLFHLCATVIQQKTGRPVPFEITDTDARSAHRVAHAPSAPHRRLPLPEPEPAWPAYSTRQYARLVGRSVAMINLEPRAYGTHSLRRTKVALAYKKTGNLRAARHPEPLSEGRHHRAQTPQSCCGGRRLRTSHRHIRALGEQKGRR